MGGLQEKCTGGGAAGLTQMKARVEPGAGRCSQGLHIQDLTRGEVTRCTAESRSGTPGIRRCTGTEMRSNQQGQRRTTRAASGPQADRGRPGERPTAGRGAPRGAVLEARRDRRTRFKRNGRRKRRPGTHDAFSDRGAEEAESRKELDGGSGRPRTTPGTRTAEPRRQRSADSAARRGRAA